VSGIIFALIAAGWAIYLLPKALRRHDDEAASRPVEEFSVAVRVLGRGVLPVRTAVPASAEAAPAPESKPVLTVTRESARRAAQRRRRVLALLLSTLVAVAATSYLSYTPWFSVAVPMVLIIAFLATARRTVRAQQTRPAGVVPDAVPDAAPRANAVADVEPDLEDEDTVGVSRAALDAALADGIAEPVLDEGGLWDPLPVTLPTYVNKARARRTIRTIELTGEGSAALTSSGHDAADSALAAEAREAAQAELPLASEAEEAAPKAAGA
jgi:hypothetical protein